MKAYERRFCPERAYRVSMMPYIVQQVPQANDRVCELVNIPLYAIGTALDGGLDKYTPVGV